MDGRGTRDCSDPRYRQVSISRRKKKRTLVQRRAIRVITDSSRVPFRGIDSGNSRAISSRMMLRACASSTARIFAFRDGGS